MEFQHDQELTDLMNLPDVTVESRHNEKKDCREFVATHTIKTVSGVVDEVDGVTNAQVVEIMRIDMLHYMGEYAETNK